ncbi:replication initiation protein [Arthrobacter phage Piccoletto]|uniref:Helix-turn-helix DNA binding domain protein n=2 Tax=Jawnskivirus TaxID=3425003 RepID=A0A222ZIX2_9CAUD|nr:replication initiation protein [Arthrobacter phage Beans]YP_009612416.1 replication initiation protein [Arthrobacter phage Piccoletto]ASR80668.1 helix-turn-helix DNA binding domain protein [Arthrobacter phage Piccoletto]ASR84713.1 helix-turn-helix DNA binding domain protein [Arthrobacter phage Beans]UVK62289.1 helix-turn-helix DNA binding domain protein [Arthrobacter phage NathanVaag]
MRTFGKIKLSAQSDPDWRGLSHTAQWLYWSLVGSESLTACGAMDYKPKHLQALSPTMNVAGVEAAMDELRAQKYVVLDEETDELLLRSYVRNDDVVLNKNMMVAVIKAWRKLASLKLRSVVVFELLRLKQEHPQAGIWEHPEMVDALRRTTPIDVRDEDTAVQSIEDDGGLVSVSGWGDSPY